MKIIFLFCLIFGVLHLIFAEYEIGVGIADVTGPIAEINFMGYGKFEQKGSGLHLRQWARSYIINDGKNVMVFVSVDVGMIGDGLRIQVIENLQKMYGDFYNFDNVIISGTHTHSAPGGFLMHFLFDISIKGFSIETFRALVDGIVQSVCNAHANRRRGKIFLGKGHVYDANINRSPTAYLQNPYWERGMYPFNVDTEITQLQFFSFDGTPLGVICWFPVHPTSMNNTNILVSSDNVGYASIKFEAQMNPTKILGQGPFVAAFASSNLGDVSPNIKGPKCQKTGKPCDLHYSTCSDPGDACIASGPGKDMFESTAIIADRLFKKAWEIWKSRGVEVTGPVKIIHQYVDMSIAEGIMKNEDGTITRAKGCVPAMGYSFAAGTTDGPGAFSFRQGTLSTNPMWNLVRNVLATPTKEDINCHYPKPILLATGRMTFPFDWQPKIVSTQLVLLGSLAIAAVPGEFTTMSGRRMKRLLSQKLEAAGLENPTVIVAGLCNTYSDYITTFEEYQVQRYEGASTLYGPHTLTLHLLQYSKLLDALLQNRPLDRGPIPQGLRPPKPSFIPPVVYDSAKLGLWFGSTTLEPQARAKPGDRITAKFVSGHPRNNVMHNGTFCTIEYQESSSGNIWSIQATDANWETKVKWHRTNAILGTSEMEVEWEIPDNALVGLYRIRHFGYHKNLWGSIYPYSGTSQTFQVLK